MRLLFFENTCLPYAKAIMDGIRCHGDRVAGRRPERWRPDEFEGGFDAVIVTGAQPIDRTIAEAYNAAGVPVSIIELGHIRRCNDKFRATDDDYLQWVWGGLNSLPAGPCPDDRRLALGIEKPRLNRKQDGHILVLGQKPGDGQHDIEDMPAWWRETRNRIAQHTSRPIVFRRHPKDRTPFAKYDGLDSSVMTLEYAFDNAWACVTCNSNAGLKALLHGLPVFCHPGASYAGIANTDLASIETPHIARKAEWCAFINCVCYAQWNLDEFRDGTAWGYVKSCLAS